MGHPVCMCFIVLHFGPDFGSDFAPPSNFSDSYLTGCSPLVFWMVHCLLYFRNAIFISLGPLKMLFRQAGLLDAQILSYHTI